MPNIKSAKKRVLVAEKKNLDNRIQRSKMTNAVKKFNNAIETLNLEEAERLLPLTISIIDKSVTKGIIHKNNAANKKSALTKILFDVKNGKKVVVIKKDNKTIAAEKAKAAQDTRDAAKLEYQRKAAEKKAAQLEKQKAELEAAKAAKKTTKKPKKDEAEDVKEKKPAKAAKKDNAEAGDVKKAAKKDEAEDVKEKKPAKKAKKDETEN